MNGRRTVPKTRVESCPINPRVLIAYNPHPHGSPRRPELEPIIAEAVGADLGRPFRPKRQLFESDPPKTCNSKILRRVVKTVVTGGDPGDLTAPLDPEAIEERKRVVGER